MLETINKDLEGEVGRKVKGSLQIRNALIFGLAKLADYRDNDTGKHILIKTHTDAHGTRPAHRGHGWPIRAK